MEEDEKVEESTEAIELVDWADAEFVEGRNAVNNVFSE